jgi:hypothetical protein
LIAEYDKLTKENELSSEDKVNTVKAQQLIADIEKYGKKTIELEEKYFETFDDEDERKYLKVKALYEKALDELAKIEAETGCTQKLERTSFNILEKIAIKGIAEQYFQFDEVKAKAIWEKNVDELGNEKTVEWLNAMSECLFKEDEEVEDISFLAQKRKRDELKANFRKNMKKR